MINFIGIKGEASEVAQFLNEWNGASEYKDVKDLKAEKEDKLVIPATVEVENNAKVVNEEEQFQELQQTEQPKEPVQAEQPKEEEKPKKSRKTLKKEEPKSDEEAMDEAFDELPDSKPFELTEKTIEPTEELDEMPEAKPLYPSEEISYESYVQMFKDLGTTLKQQGKYPARSALLRAIFVVYGESTFANGKDGVDKSKYAYLAERINEKNRIETVEKAAELLKALGIEKDAEKDGWGAYDELYNQYLAQQSTTPSEDKSEDDYEF